MTGPWFFLGHSIGALIGFEAVLSLQGDNNAVPPARVFLCGVRPGEQVTAIGKATAPDAEVVEYLRLLGGLPEQLFASPEMLAAVLVVARRDLAMVEGYTTTDGSPLRCPVSVYGGADDVTVPVAELDQWRRFAADVRIRVFPGGHFFLHEQLPIMVEALSDDCHASVA
jgi:surfactin synthase thioesterase subunit